MEDAQRKSRPPKFKHTRELVRIALDDGLTQDEVARLCRTQQSVVSAWAAGRSKAREDVVKPLLARYGHRLNRTSSRVYLVRQDPPVPWEGTDEGRLAARLLGDPEGYAREVMADDEVEVLVRKHVRRRLRPEYVAGPVADEQAQNGAATRVRMPAIHSIPTADAPRDGSGELAESAFLPLCPEDLAEAAARVDWKAAPAVRSAWRQLCPGAENLFEVDAPKIAGWLEEGYRERHLRLVRVEGAPVWRHVVGTVKAVRRREGRDGERIVAELDPVERWVVHPAGQGRFRLVVQRLRRLVGAEARVWERALRVVHVGSRGVEDEGRVRSDDDVARWVCEIHGPLDLLDLLAQVEALLPDAGPHDRATVPFTLRKALVERGYDVPGVDFLPL